MSAMFNAAKVRFNEDEKKFIDNQDRIYFESLHVDIKDLKFNGKEWITDAVTGAVKGAMKEFKEEADAKIERHERKLKRHDWWLWALSGTVMAIIAILIFLK